MLTDEQKLQNELQYKSLVKGILNDQEYNLVIPYLDAIKFFDAPASAQYNGAYVGGLCEYSLKLAHELGVLCTMYFPGKYTEEDILKVALFKDIYRAQMYESYKRNVKNELTGQWEVVFAYRTKENRPVYGELGFSSYMLLRPMIQFSDEQLEAILYSSGNNSYSADIYGILNQYPLVTLTRMASEAVLYLFNNKEFKKDGRN